METYDQQRDIETEGQRAIPRVAPSKNAAAQKPNHTPGPWHLGNDNNYYAEVCFGDSGAVASVGREDINTAKVVFGREVMLANTHLIIAAPDMLAALVRLSRKCDKGFTFCAACNYVEGAGHAIGCFLEAAIMKAEGRQQ